MKQLLPALMLLIGSHLPLQAQLAPFDGGGLTYGHVHLAVSDLELHTSIWVEHFGGEVVERGPMTAIRFPTLLLVLTEEAPVGGSQGTVMDHFGFKVRDLAAVLARWRAAGYEVQSEFTGAEGFPNAYLIAPDSVRVELQEDTTLAVDYAGHHIHFFAPAHEALMAWYVDAFGLEPFQRGRLLTTANAPGMNLTFAGSETPREPSRRHAIDHIGFEVRDLDAFVETLKAKGVELDVPVHRVPATGIRTAFLTDPAGVTVELSEGLIDF